MNIPYVFKKCSKCGEWLVANSVNFHKNKRNKKYGLMSICKKCDTEQTKKYYQNNKGKKQQYDKQYRQNNKEKIQQYQKQYSEEHKQEKQQYNKQYAQQNKDKIKQYQQQYRDEHTEELAQYRKKWNKEHPNYHKEYHINNKDKRNEKSKEWRDNNKEYLKQYSSKHYKENEDKIKEYQKQYRSEHKTEKSIYDKKYRENNPQIQFNSANKRRQREQYLGRGISKEQWLACMKYFEFKDGYSGEVLTNENRTIDHIIPLLEGGLNEPWNIVPMTRSNNCSKKDKNMEEWYKQQEFYSEDRLQRIYEWQQYAYNKWSKQDEELAL